MNELAHPNNTPNIIIERGKRAYQKIKVDAATMRENWRAVGEALLVGRKMHPSNQAFGKWCAEEGFDMDARVRSDAMWLAENWGSVFQRLENAVFCSTENAGFCSTETTAVTPTEIRRQYNETRKSGPLPVDLSEITPEPIVELDQRSAEKITKLVKRSQASDEGSELAKRHVKILAEKHGTTVEKLSKAAARKVPELYYGLTDYQIHHVKDLEEGIENAFKEMLVAGLTPEAVKDVFYRIVDSM